MAESVLFPRFAQPRLEEALTDTPVVLVHGPRQCGKTTLARKVGKKLGYGYISFDDNTQLAAAKADPVGFVAELPPKIVLDEVQRAPGLFLAIKSAVDRDRRPGRFILTGSANILLVPRLADSLAGRMEILRLHPLAQCEVAKHRSVFLDGLFLGKLRQQRFTRLAVKLADRMIAGGFPAALTRPVLHRQAAWYRDYIVTVVQRDVRDLARIGAIDALPRLLQLAASQTAHLVNVAELAGAFHLSRPTIRDYVALLERVFLLDHLPPWHTNRLSRLVKTPKLHLGDTGLAASLLGLDRTALWADRAVFGQLLETFVFQELRRQAGWQKSAVTFSHFRDKDGGEVDIVLERSGIIVGVEIKAGATVTGGDFRGLRKLQEAAGARFAAGAVMYDGDALVGFGKGLFAVPLQALWETG